MKFVKDREYELRKRGLVRFLREGRRKPNFKAIKYELLSQKEEENE